MSGMEEAFLATPAARSGIFPLRGVGSSAGPGETEGEVSVSFFSPQFVDRQYDSW